MDPDQTASYRSSLIWVHTVCLYVEFSPRGKHLHAADTILDAFFVAGVDLNSRGAGDKPQEW